MGVQSCMLADWMCYSNLQNINHGYYSYLSYSLMPAKKYAVQIVLSSKINFLKISILTAIPLLVSVK